MRLNGWQRIGLVLTICWIVGGGLWVNGMVIDAMGANVRSELQRCLDARSIQPDGTVPKDTDWGLCTRRFDAEFIPAVANHWTYAIVYTLVPIPLAWGLVYALAGLGRWIAVGFRQSA